MKLKGVAQFSHLHIPTQYIIIMLANLRQVFYSSITLTSESVLNSRRIVKIYLSLNALTHFVLGITFYISFRILFTRVLWIVSCNNTRFVCVCQSECFGLQFGFHFRGKGVMST